jgi:O-antigen/teichoic acid export membrane protein
MKSLLAKLNNKHVFSLAGNASTAVMAMVVVGLLYRLVPDKAATGGWIVFQTAYMLTDTFRSGFLNAAMISFYAGATPERQRDVAGSSWFLGLCITVVVTSVLGLAWLALPDFETAGVNDFLRYGGLTFLASLPQFIGGGLLQAKSQFDRFMWVRLLSQFLFIVLLLAGYYWATLSTTLIVQLNLAAQAVCSLVVLVLGWADVASLAHRTKACVAELFHFGKYSFGSYLSSTLFRVSDNFIITAMLGPAALAVYNLGIRLMEIVEIPLRSFAATAMPEMSIAYNRGEKRGLVRILCRYTGLITVAMIVPCLGALLFADVAIYLIGGKEWAGTEAANVLRIYMSFALLYPADRFCAIALDSVKKSRINFYKVLAMLVANVVADYAGIKLFGNLYGVALGTLAPIVLGTVVGYLALQGYQRFPFLHLFRYGWKDLRLLVLNKMGRVPAAS